jgi:hypothetical protein
MSGGPGAGPVEPAAGDEGLAREQALEPGDPLTLATMCACGHGRKDHRGLHMEAKGPCLQCDCQEFTRERAQPRSHEQMTDVRAALGQVQQAREILASLRALLGRPG